MNLKLVSKKTWTDVKFCGQIQNELSSEVVKKDSMEKNQNEVKRIKQMNN